LKLFKFGAAVEFLLP